jgi:hypothetical protein
MHVKNTQSSKVGWAKNRGPNDFTLSVGGIFIARQKEASD